MVTGESRDMARIRAMVTVPKVVTAPVPVTLLEATVNKVGVNLVYLSKQI